MPRRLCRPRRAYTEECGQSGVSIHGSRQRYAYEAAALVVARMADRPDIGRYRREVPLGEWASPHGRHHALVALGLGHALGDNVAEARQAAVAPQPVCRVERRPDRAAAGVRAMAAAAGAVGGLTVEDAVAERHLRGCGARRCRQGGSLAAGIGMHALGRRDGLRRRCGWRGRCRRWSDLVGAVAAVGDAPDPAMHVVADVERAVRPDGETRRTEGCAARLLVLAGESVGEHDIGSGCLAVGQRLEDDVVSALRQGRAVPRAVKGDEGAAAIAGRKLGAEIDRERVGRPMAGKSRDGALALSAEADGLAAVSAIFRREHELLLILIVVAFRPTVVGARRELDELLRRQVRALLGGVEARPVLVELVSAVLRGKQAAGRVEGEAFAVAQARGVTFSRREDLAGLVGVVTPDPAARLLLDAGIDAARGGDAIFRLAGVGRRAEVDEQVALAVDDEGMHRVIAGERQAGHDDGRRRGGHPLARGESVSEDAAILLGVQRAVVECDAGAAGAARLRRLAEALDEVGVAVALGVL